MTVFLPPLACSVRGCYEPLRRLRDSYVCSRGHSYDVARSGYVNLLQPQDRKSLDAGDSRAAVEARAELIAAGVGRAVIDSIVTRVADCGSTRRNRWLWTSAPVPARHSACSPHAARFAVSGSTSPQPPPNRRCGTSRRSHGSWRMPIAGSRCWTTAAT